MITRDNRASISGTAQNARQRLGEVIKFHRTSREWSVREVAKRCKCSVTDVEAFEAGRLVPNGEQWKSLCMGINRALHSFNDLRMRALDEQRAEQETITRSITNMNNGHHKVGTNLGAKLGSVQLASVPGSNKPAPDSPTAPTSDARTVNPGQPVTYHAQPTAIPPEPTRDTTKLKAALQSLPVGWKSRTANEQRRAFALEELRKRPTIRTSGADSLDEMLQRTFGVGLSDSTIRELRAQVQREKLKAEILAEMPPVAQVHRIEATPTPGTIPAIVDAPIPTGEVNNEDLEAAVQLVLGAIPGLQTFTITVDEHGEASVDYQIRKVVVTTAGGSLKVRR